MRAVQTLFCACIARAFCARFGAPLHTHCIKSFTSLSSLSCHTNAAFYAAYARLRRRAFLRVSCLLPLALLTARHYAGTVADTFFSVCGHNSTPLRISLRRYSISLNHNISFQSLSLCIIQDRLLYRHLIDIIHITSLLLFGGLFSQTVIFYLPCLARSLSYLYYCTLHLPAACHHPTAHACTPACLPCLHCY